MHSTTLIAAILSAAAFVSAAPQAPAPEPSASTTAPPSQGTDAPPTGPADIEFMCNCGPWPIEGEGAQKRANEQAQKCCNKLSSDQSVAQSIFKYNEIENIGSCGAFNAKNQDLQTKMQDLFQACCTEQSTAGEFGPFCDNGSATGLRTAKEFQEWQKTCGAYKGCYMYPEESVTEVDGVLMFGGVPFSGDNGGLRYQDGKLFTGTDSIGNIYKDGVKVGKEEKKPAEDTTGGAAEDSTDEATDEAAGDSTGTPEEVTETPSKGSTDEPVTDDKTPAEGATDATTEEKESADISAEKSTEEASQRK